ncbi:GntR family transcriptional regulator [Clostridium bovifaecis]|uniref:GntR family transcriptional regulator n=1 Tax=Clostridium bovifaecis TaxID=2184719 RepID=A0A6I6EYP5_9CLOT|nr:GntR family transcriptional regulator [Clostridium bovifaecis]
MKEISTSRRNLSQKAYEQIKYMILHLEIKPGERIPEEKLADVVSGSRTPVREALRRLSEEGLVNIYPGRFSEVAYYDEEAVKQIGVLRLSQDLLSCQLAITNGSNADFALLNQLAEKCEIGARSGNIYERIAFDLEFHLQIAQIGANKLLIQNQKKLYMLIHLIQISKYTSVQDSIAQIENHRDIINALYNRDFKAIKVIICKHLQSFYDIDQEIIDMYLK